MNERLNTATGDFYPASVFAKRREELEAQRNAEEARKNREKEEQKHPSTEYTNWHLYNRSENPNERYDICQSETKDVIYTLNNGFTLKINSSIRIPLEEAESPTTVNLPDSTEQPNLDTAKDLLAKIMQQDTVTRTMLEIARSQSTYTVPKPRPGYAMANRIRLNTILEKAEIDRLKTTLQHNAQIDALLHFTIKITYDDKTTEAPLDIPIWEITQSTTTIRNLSTQLPPNFDPNLLRITIQQYTP